MQPLVKFSEAATEHIQHIIVQQKAKAFRLSLKKTGCNGLMYVPELVSTPKESDIKFEAREGLTVFIDKKWADIISGTTVDFIDKGLGQQQLTFKNPRAKGECGCGESFNVG